ncbi:MAG: pitrilysin family protein, partial [Pseudomonadota bacterium]
MSAQGRRRLGGRRPEAGAGRHVLARARFAAAATATAIALAAGLGGCAHDGGDVGAGGRRPVEAVPARGGPVAGGGAVDAGKAARPPSEDPAAAFWRGRLDLLQSPPPPKLAALNLPRVERWRQANGLEVVAVPRPDLPIISFSMAIKAGGYDEVNGRNEGAADFTAAMLRKGTGRRTADQIAEAIDNVGGSLDAGANMESSTVTCSVLAKDTALCLDLLAELTLRPTFPDGEMPEIRDQLLAGIAARADDPHQLAAEHLGNLLFGEGHPDGWVLTEDDVRRVTRQTLTAFWKAFYRPNNAILAVAGDFEVAGIKQGIERAFGKWESAPVPARPAFQVPPPGDMRVVVVDKPDLTQATLMAGHAGVRHADPDWYAVTLMNYVLGGSDFSSRLMTEVRSKRGLTYGIGSSFGASLYQGAFRISAATRNETAGEALAVTVAELAKMKAEGPTAA